MKKTLAALLFLFPVLMGAACDKNTPRPADANENYLEGNTDSMSDTLVIRVGSKTFAAILLDNPAATAFKAMLPLAVDMTELNGNEKYFRLSRNLPTDASDPGTITSGDLMLWGSNTFVLFYETFSTPYSYTKLGTIINATGLAAALGTGNVTVSISVK